MFDSWWEHTACGESVEPLESAWWHRYNLTSFHRSMDRTTASEAVDVGSIPTGSTDLIIVPRETI